MYLAYRILFNESGDARPDFGLADLFGVHIPAERLRMEWAARVRRATETNHTYLRLTPEFRARVYGPKSGTEPARDSWIAICIISPAA